MRWIRAIPTILLTLWLAYCGGETQQGTTDQEAVGGMEVAEAIPSETVDAGELSVTIHADKTKGNAPLSVKFTAEISGCDPDDADYLWTFAPGTYSQKRDPGVFIFQVEGVYKVTLDVHCRSNDRLGSDSIQILVRAQAELALSKVTVTSPTTLAPGDVVLLSFDVFNRGGQIEDPFMVYIVLSKDEVYQDSKDLVLKEIVIESMADGRYSDVRQSFSSEPAPLPPDLVEGSYFLFVVVDPEDVVNETNESNNVAQATSYISVRLDAKAKPDLTISPAEFAPGTKVGPGEAFPFSVTLSNIGQKPAKNFRFGVFASSDSNWSPDDASLVSDEISLVYNLDAGKSLTISGILRVPVNAQPGIYTVIAVVDTTNAVYESDEMNNIAVTPYAFEVIETVVHGFDLALKSIFVTPHDTYLNGSIKVVVTIANQGDKATPKFPISYFISKEPSLNPNYDDKLAELKQDPIPAGGSIEVTTVVNIPNGPQYVGDFYVSAVVDVNAQLDELDETNNWLIDPKPIHIYKEAFVDVALSDLVFHPVVVEAGKEIKVAYTMTNKGSTASGAFVNYIVLSPDNTVSMNDVQAMKDYVIGKVTIDSISPSETIERIEKVPVPVALPHDVETYYVAVLGDALGNIKADTNKKNQTVISDTVLTVLGPKGGCFEDEYEPNNDAASATPLTTTEIAGMGLCGGEDWFSISLRHGQSLMVMMTLEEPLYLVPQPFDLDLQIVGPNGKALETADTTGPVEKIAVFAVEEEGTYYIRVYPKTAMARAHYSLTVEVLDPANMVDLSPLNVFAKPDSIYPGGLVAVSTTIANLGGEPAAPSEAMIVLSADFIPDEGDVVLADVPVPALNPISKETIKTAVKIPTYISGGDYFILVVADPKGVLVESNEANNIAISGKVEVDESMICADDAFEPNDSIEFATPLSATTSVYSGLGVCPDLPDVYSFELPEGVSFEVALTYDYKQEKGYLAIDVMDATGAILDSMPVSSKPVAGLPYVFLEGTYYIRVRVNPSAGKAGPYQYDMTVKVGQPLPQDVCLADGREPNNDFVNATSLGCGVNRLTMCKKDRDFFKVPLSKDKSISLSLSQAKSELKASIYTDPKASAIKTLSGNGSLDFVATDDVDVYIVVEPKSTSLTEYNYTLTLVGVPGRDIAIGPVALKPSEVWQGDDVQMTFMLSNGCKEQVEPFDVMAYLSSDTVLDPADVPIAYSHVSSGIPPMGELEVVTKGMIPLASKPGDYYVLVQADPNGLILESQEDNNIGSAKVKVMELCKDDPLEPNDAPDEATVIAPGVFYDLMICPWDVDWMRFHAPAGAHVKVSLSAPVSYGDLDLRVYSANDPTVPIAISATKSDIEMVDFVSSLDSDYLIRIAGFLGDFGHYDLEVVVGP